MALRLEHVPRRRYFRQWALEAVPDHAAVFAEAERDRVRERIGQVKANQKARAGYRRGERGGLAPRKAAEQAAIREMVARDEGKPLRA